MKRREFLQSAAVAAAAGMLPNVAAPPPKFKISLAAWSVHKAFFAGRMKMIDQVAFCREMGIGGLELVNSFFPSPQYRYLRELKKTAGDNGVEILLIMCDSEGDMAHKDRAERMRASRNHHKWVDIAQVLGCHSIRCNAGSGGPRDAEAIRRSAEAFAPLCDYAGQAGLDVIIENHGGFSSYPTPLLDLIERVDKPNFGTLPDFGNFPEAVDRYEAVRRMMRYAKAVSAKCYDFDERGDETRVDYARMMSIVLEAGYRSWVGIEYEGNRLPEKEGVRACKTLLERYQ